MRPLPLSRALAAEALGTLLLVATVVGSGIMAERLTADIALQLLANALATVAMLLVLISLFGPVSGAHFNPAVSLVMTLRRGLPVSALGVYVAAQVAGGILGTVLAHAMFGLPLIEFAGPSRMGAGQWLAEFVATFGLVLTILVGQVSRPAALPALVAAYIGAAYWFTASTSFANPAITIARAFTASFSGIAPASVAGFVLAQLAGAGAALVLAQWLLAAPKKEKT
jgi:glycerol uptake facilitator-like aquaporin